MARKAKTLADLVEEVRAGKTVLTAEDIHGVMGVSAHTIRLWAKQAPQFLPGPMREPILSGNPADLYNARVKFPAIPTLRYFGADI